MPDLDLVTANNSRRVFTLVKDARPVLLNLGKPGAFDITPWADRVQLIEGKYVGPWELPVIGMVTAPAAVNSTRRICCLGRRANSSWAR
jgi:3-(3-hydroxy-phenyl)propionate hydroxylase